MIRRKVYLIHADGFGVTNIFRSRRRAKRYVQNLPSYAVFHWIEEHLLR